MERCKPFRFRGAQRHASGGAIAPDRRSADQRALAAYEWVASSYGWDAPYVQDHLTDEQLLAYLEQSEHRLTREHQRAVEVVRAGFLFAHDAKAYSRWRARQVSGALTGAGGGGLAGAELEQVIAAMSVSNPDIVTIRTAPRVN